MGHLPSTTNRDCGGGGQNDGGGILHDDEILHDGGSLPRHRILRRRGDLLQCDQHRAA